MCNRRCCSCTYKSEPAGRTISVWHGASRIHVCARTWNACGAAHGDIHELSDGYCPTKCTLEVYHWTHTRIRSLVNTPAYRKITRYNITPSKQNNAGVRRFSRHSFIAIRCSPPIRLARTRVRLYLFASKCFHGRHNDVIVDAPLCRQVHISKTLCSLLHCEMLLVHRGV